MKKFEDLAPNSKHALMNKIHTVQPYWTMLGIKLVDIKKDGRNSSYPIPKISYNRMEPFTVAQFSL